MDPIPPTAEKTAHAGFVPRLSLYYAAQFLVLGIQMPFFPVWLAAKGLDASAIGIVLAGPPIVRVLAVPAATRLADRYSVVRGALVAASIFVAAAFVLVGLSSGFLAIFITVLLGSIAFGPTFPLADAYALRGLAERGRSYGSVRLWGSAAFVAANLGAGVLAGMIAPGNLIWLIVAAYCMLALAAAGLAPSAAAPVSHLDSAISHRTLWRSGAFVTVVAGASLVQASHAVFYGFSTLDWAAKGLGGTTIGMLWALGVIAEIALFALSARLPAIIGPIELIALGALGAVVRWTAMAFDPPFAALPALQCLHALSFGATHLGLLLFLARAAPPRMAATAQGDAAAMQGIVFAVAMGLSGALYEAYGSLAYGAMAVLAAAGALLALAVHRMPRDRAAT